MRWTFGPMGVVLLGVAACTSPPPEQAVPPPPAALETLTLAATPVARVQIWEGQVEAVERATLAAQTGGRVARLEVDVGDVVEEGQILVRFTEVEQRSAQRQAGAELAAARARAEEAAAALTRAESVHARRLAAQAELDRARAAHDAAQAALAAARAGLKRADEQVGYTAIRAPSGGVITARHVEPGETVAPGQALLSGVSLERLRLVLDLPQRLVAQLAPDTPVRVVLADGRRLEATALSVFPQADAATQTVTVRLSLPEGVAGLKPGMSVRAEFELGADTALLVPATALARRGEVQSVYLLREDGAVVLRQVRSGRQLSQGVEILAGLAPGDTVARDAVAAAAARRAQFAARTER